MQEYPSEWPLEPMSEEELRTLRVQLVGNYVAGTIAILAAAAVLVAILFLVFYETVPRVIVVALLAVGSGFGARMWIRYVGKTVAKDVSGAQKVVFSGVLTQACESEGSRKRRHAQSPTTGTVTRGYIIEIDGLVQIECMPEVIRTLDGVVGSRVHGAFTPHARFLLHVEPESATGDGR